jgi:hypothetical protein
MYEFSPAALIWGILIMAASATFIRFHRQIANAIGGGLGSYEKYKLYGLIGVGIGVLMMFNIPVFLLKLVASMFFGR